MRFLLILTFFSIPFYNYSQKKYHFDTAFEFHVEIDVKDIIKDSTWIFMLNSKENNIKLNLIEKDSLNYDLKFLDENGNYVSGIIDKNKLAKAETINNDCMSVRRFTNRYKNKVEKYYFENLNDTLINESSYFHYAIKCNKSLKHIKRKDIHEYHFIVDKNSDDFSPFFIRSTSYEEWKKERNIPNGKPFIIYFKNYKKEITFKVILKNEAQIDKYFTIPEECDYTVIGK